MRNLAARADRIDYWIRRHLVPCPTHAKVNPALQRRVGLTALRTNTRPLRCVIPRDVLRGKQPPLIKFPMIESWQEDHVYHEGELVGGSYQAVKDGASADYGGQRRAAYPGAAAQTRMVSVAEIRRGRSLLNVTQPNHPRIGFGRLRPQQVGAWHAPACPPAPQRQRRARLPPGQALVSPITASMEIWVKRIRKP